MKAQSVGGGWSGIATGYPLVRVMCSIWSGRCPAKGPTIVTRAGTAFRTFPRNFLKDSLPSGPSRRT